MASWQVQQAKSRLSELLEKVETEGPQTITKHGVDTAVVMSIEEFKKLRRPEQTLIDLFLSGPKFDDFELPPRQIDPPREFDWDDAEDDAVQPEK